MIVYKPPFFFSISTLEEMTKKYSFELPKYNNWRFEHRCDDQNVTIKCITKFQTYP
jgi:hypothetical protein